MALWWRVALAGAAIPAAGAVTVAVVLVRAQGYEPLVQGSYARSDATVVQRPDGTEDLQLPWRPGTTQELTVSVRNNGSHSLRLDGVDYARPSAGPVLVARAQWAASTALTRTHDFPVDLAAGEEVSVQLSVEQRSCGWTPRTGAGFDLLQVRTTRLGRTHTWRVPEIPQGFSVTAPAVVPARFSAPC